MRKAQAKPLKPELKIESHWEYFSEPSLAFLMLMSELLTDKKDGLQDGKRTDKQNPQVL